MYGSNDALQSQMTNLDPISCYPLVDCENCNEAGCTTIATDNYVGGDKPIFFFGYRVVDRNDVKECSLCGTLICDNKKCINDSEFIYCGPEPTRQSHYIPVRCHYKLFGRAWLCKKCQITANITSDYQGGVSECEFCYLSTCERCKMQFMRKCRVCGHLYCLDEHMDLKSELCTDCSATCSKCSDKFPSTSMWSCDACFLHNNQRLCQTCTISVRFPGRCRNKTCLENNRCIEHSAQVATSFCDTCTRRTADFMLPFAKTMYLDYQMRLLDLVLNHAAVLRDLVMQYSDMFLPELLDLNELATAFVCSDKIARL